MTLDGKQFLTFAACLSRGLFLKVPALAKAKTSAPTGQVRISDVKNYVFKNATFIKIETDAGISGWGEADHDYPKLTAAVVDEICKKELIGRDPFNSEKIWHTIFFKGEDAGSTGLLPGALAGVDNALWDLKGKLLNMPVNKIPAAFGNRRSERL
ncbi:MAG: hypothetical protein U5K79_11850 [Cyclobacteriaceae bacterium]|nr:hypothetical protein [Cyclobacteriaceae bacterium]